MAKARLGPELSRAANMMQNGRLKEAEAICRDVLRHRKNDVDACQMLGLVESMKGRFDLAVDAFERGLKIKPDGVMLLCGLAKARTSQGRYDDAIRHYDQALAVEPGYPPAVAGKAEALEHAGAFDEARALLAPEVAAGRELAESALIYATLEQRDKRDAEAVALLRRHLDGGLLAPITRRKLLFCIGKSYEKLGRYDEAFAAFRDANELNKRPFDIAVVRQKFDRVMETFSAEAIPSLARSSIESELPIFVVSMPRSGSTLVEQILSSHPLVHGAGEIDAMIKRLNEVPREVRSSSLAYPEIVRNMNEKAAERLGRRYLDRVARLDRSAERIVDKNLQNFRLLGLISMILPKARVIYCRRDPMSICFSCYQLPLSPVALPYTTDLRNLGLFYREYERLMQHWMDVLDIPILPVQYEELVADQERISRDIIEFAGLAWDDACLRFYDSGRSVATASYDQVRQPIYKAAVERYKHYDAHLGPLREGLGPQA